MAASSEPPMLLELIEQDILRRTKFGVKMTGGPDKLAIECQMDKRGTMTVYVLKRSNQWIMSDLCFTVRAAGFMWQRYPQEVRDILEKNSTQDNMGELWLYIDSDSTFYSLCSLLCSMLEILACAMEIKLKEGKKP